MKRIFPILAIGFILAGCASLERAKTTWDAVTSAKIAPQTVILAADTFDALEATGTVYISQKKCPKGINVPTCRDPGITKTIIENVKTGRKARDAMIAFLKAHPGELGDSGLYDALNLAVATLQDIFEKNKIGATP